MSSAVRRLAVVVSHPIQYSVPLYQRLSQRDDLEIKVFFTWHAGAGPVEDRGFARPVAWDIPMTQDYEFEPVPNVSRYPGTHHFFGLRNPSLVGRVTSWQPDIVHVTGWAWLSHLQVMHGLRRLGTPIMFRGDSHLLDPVSFRPRWWIKRAILRRVFSWPAVFLVVGSANRSYYEAFGVEPARLFPCPHSIDVARFAEPAATLEEEAARWRQELGIGSAQKVVLFAGKFESKKRPVNLMRAVQQLASSDVVMVLVGGGELQNEIDAIAATDPARFRVLPFQNQSRMPIVYRIGDVFVLPSARGETWGLAVNEALACGRPVLVSDRVGCAPDLVNGTYGAVFPSNDLSALTRTLGELINNPELRSDMRRTASEHAWSFDIAVTETALVEAMAQTLAR
jgi:glycosyltransferase involved in cell wall biosynthesis